MLQIRNVTLRYTSLTMVVCVLYFLMQMMYYLPDLIQQ